MAYRTQLLPELSVEDIEVFDKNDLRLKFAGLRNRNLPQPITYAPFDAMLLCPSHLQWLDISEDVLGFVPKAPHVPDIVIGPGKVKTGHSAVQIAIRKLLVIRKARQQSLGNAWIDRRKFLKSVIHETVK